MSISNERSHGHDSQLAYAQSPLVDPILTIYYFVLYYIILCCIVLYYIMFCYIMLCYVIYL